MLRDEDTDFDFINSQCSAVIVSTYVLFVGSYWIKHGLLNYIFALSPQIGNRFALTAAHCLYDDDKEEVLPATTFSIMLGLHDRKKTSKENRWLKIRIKIFICPFYNRTQIRVTKVLVHENFTDYTNDIALLRLGRLDFSTI